MWYSSATLRQAFASKQHLETRLKHLEHKVKTEGKSRIRMFYMRLHIQRYQSMSTHSKFRNHL